MKAQWRHGVTGVEDADQDLNSEIYGAPRQAELSMIKQKQDIKRRREKTLLKHNGTNYQIEIGSDNCKVPLNRFSSLQNKEKVVDLNQTWHSKGKSPSPIPRSYDRIFSPPKLWTRDHQEGCPRMPVLDRTLNLEAKITNGKKYNIVTGEHVDREAYLKVKSN